MIEPWIISDCSFDVSEGESVAIVGPSGCGKTTLAKLLLGLLTPNEGSIEYGGIELSGWSPATFRQLAAAVMQEDQLFAGSIAENICFFEPTADWGMIEAAAAKAGIHDEIRIMPMSYHTLIGDMGTNLSGGQKQRIILARALFRNPSVLILDEATSHLDVKRESAVNDAIRGLSLTRIIIAHRLETIASADRVLELRDGKVLESPDPPSSPVNPATHRLT
ncbi:MAG: ATP-binding cassette domain-containing protein [Phycisphaerales bacterium]|nr:ATP-binding cassette domain-containing protein [Phycisphaerales bacterium]